MAVLNKKSMIRVLEIENALSSFVGSKVGEHLRKELNSMFTKQYKPKLSPEQYLRFITVNIENIDISKVGAQCEDRPCFLCMFTIKYQHTYGNSLEHLIDNTLGLNENLTRR